MKKKNILYVGAMGMGDNILSIPFFMKLKEKGYKITLLRYHTRYFGKHFHYVSDDVLNLLSENHLFDDILYIPYNKIKLLLFVLKNLFVFDCVYVPVRTSFSVFWAWLLGKKNRISFKNINDTHSFSGLVQGLLQDNSIDSLFMYRKSLKIPKDSSYIDRYGLHGKFATVFPSIFERSIPASEWHKVVSYLEEKGIMVVLIGGVREEWLYDDLKPYKHKNIKNLCGKTNFKEIMNILSDAQVNISANGGIMWLGHLLNKYNISFHITSSYLTEPPVDNIHSFNIRKYNYACCKPCEPFYYRFTGKKGIPCCVFSGTDREGECLRSVSGEDILYYLQKIYVS